MEWWQHLAGGLVTGLFTAGALWGVIRTEFKYIRRDVDLAHKRIDDFVDTCVQTHRSKTS